MLPPKDCNSEAGLPGLAVDTMALIITLLILGAILLFSLASDVRAGTLVSPGHYVAGAALLSLFTYALSLNSIKKQMKHARVRGAA